MAWRISRKSKTVYRVKGKGKSNRTTYKTKKSAKRHLKKKH